MSLDFLTVTEYCNKRAAIRHYLRSEESHDLYPMILEELTKKSEKSFLKGIRTLRELQRRKQWFTQFCYFHNDFALSAIPVTLIMNKEAVRYFIENRLLDSILLETAGSFVLKTRWCTSTVISVGFLTCHHHIPNYWRNTYKEGKVIINKIIIH